MCFINPCLGEMHCTSKTVQIIDYKVVTEMLTSIFIQQSPKEDVQKTLRGGIFWH